MRECANCHAKVPDGQGGTDPHGRFICCPACVFNPLGCRCRYGEYGIEETWMDPDGEPEYEAEYGFDDDDDEYGF